jgi:SAM-dependent methyltransferase
VSRISRSKRVAIAGLACFVGLLATAADRSFSDAEYWAARWEGPERDAWQFPIEVLGLIGVDEGEVVADLGAGTGYFTRLLATVVGEKGRVFAVDIEPAMLAYIRGREDLFQERVETVQARPDDPGLPDAAIDLVLIVNTWHHVKKRPAYLQKLDRALKPDGRVVVIDFHKTELPVGPPLRQKLSREEVVAEFEEAGWRLVTDSAALPFQYLLTFYPPREREALTVIPDPLPPY